MLPLSFTGFLHNNESPFISKILCTIKKYLLLTVVLPVIFIAACKDETVTVIEEDFDPPRFNWRSTEILGSDFSGIWAKDTNNIYLINYFPANFTHIFKGNTETFNIGNYGVTEMEGISENEVYIFGAVPYPDNTLTIIKWNGTGFEYFPTGINVGTNNAQIKGCVVNSNEVWIGTENGLSRFDGTNLYNYTYENPNLFLKDLFLGDNNRVQYISERQFNETTLQTSLYEFRDTGFVMIFDEIINPYPTINLLNQINGYKIGIEHNLPNRTVCLNNFSGSGYTNYYCFSNKITIFTLLQSNNPVGIGLQNFTAFVEVNNNEIFTPGYRSGIIHWNGSKPSAEIGVSVGSGYPSDKPILFSINDLNYLVLEPPSPIHPSSSVLYKGIKK